MRRLRIMVTAVGGGVGQSILRSLRVADLDCFLIGADMYPLSAGFAICDKAYLLPPASDPQYKEKLLEICAWEKVDYLFPGSDPELLPVAQVKKELKKQNCHAIVADEKCIKICRNKLSTYQFLKSKKLPFAESVSHPKLQKLIKSKGFPIIAKPIDGSSSRDIKVFFSTSELSLTDTQKLEGYLFQEYLTPIQWGKRKDQLCQEDIIEHGALKQEHEISIQILKGPSGETLGIFTSENVLKNGVPIKVVPFQMLEAEKLAERAADALLEVGLVGPLNTQGKLTEEGLVLFELNPRFTGITATRTLMGFRECEAMIYSLENKPLEEIKKLLHFKTDQVGLRFIDEYVIDKQTIEKLATQGEVTLKKKDTPS